MTKQNTMTFSALPPYGSEIQSLTWGAWIKAGVVLVKNEMARAGRWLIDWASANEERRKLLEMEPHRLKDIGITRAEAIREGEKSI